MSSGSIESGEYHRAQRLGEGGFGSVRTVYDNDGQVYAVRFFVFLFSFTLINYVDATTTVETFRRRRG